MPPAAASARLQGVPPVRQQQRRGLTPSRRVPLLRLQRLGSSCQAQRQRGGVSRGAQVQASCSAPKVPGGGEPQQEPHLPAGRVLPPAAQHDNHGQRQAQHCRRMGGRQCSVQSRRVQGSSPCATPPPQMERDASRMPASTQATSQQADRRLPPASPRAAWLCSAAGLLANGLQPPRAHNLTAHYGAAVPNSRHISACCTKCSLSSCRAWRATTVMQNTPSTATTTSSRHCSRREVARGSRLRRCTGAVAEHRTTSERRGSCAGGA